MEMIKVVMDRPLGSSHPKYPDMIYSINYGYVEDKWAVCPVNMTFSQEEIDQQIYFQEKYYDSEIVMLGSD